MTVAFTTQNKVRALHDYWFFLDLIRFKGGNASFADIHQELAALVSRPEQLSAGIKLDGSIVSFDEQITRYLILMPRGHLKSTVVSVGYVLWRIYRNPNIRIVVGTNVNVLAWSFIRELRSYLEDELLKTKVWNARPHINGPLIPELDRSGRRRSGGDSEATDKKVIWSATAIQVLRSKKMKEPTVQATSVGSRLTGGHFDLLILDDVVDFKNSANPELIQKVYEWCQDLESVLDPRRIEKVSNIATYPLHDIVGDQVIACGTRYAKGDYYEYLIENKEELGYHVLSKNIYKNGKNPEDGYLWEERFNKTVIDKLRRRLSKRRFASQYLNTIIVEGEVVLNPENIQYYPTTAASIQPGEVKIRLPGKEGTEKGVRLIRPYMTIDPAISEQKKADNTAIVVGGFDQYGEFWVLEAHVGKFRPLDTAHIVHRLVNRWKLGSYYMEQVGAFRAVGYTVHEYLKSQKLYVALRDYSPGRSNKKTRIENYCEPFFSTSTIWMPRELSTNDTIQDEILYFPSEVVHDDFLDALAMCIENARPPLSEAQRKNIDSKPAFSFRNRRYGGTR